MAVIRALIPLITVGLLVFSLVDLITIDGSRVRHLPKFAWILIVILLPIIGPLLWLLVGRERAARERVDPNNWEPQRAAEPRRRRGPGGPDDDPEFLDRLRREREQEERIRQLEERLAELDDDGKKND